MSIYFLHFLSAFLPISLYLFFFARDEKPYFTLPLILAGATFGYFAYQISLEYKGGLRNLYLSINILLIMIFALFWAFGLKFKAFKFLNFAILFLLGFCFTAEYFYISNGFPIFTQKLLDSLSVINFAFVILAFCFIILIFFMMKFMQNIIINRAYFWTLAGVFWLINVLKFAAEILLIGMQKGFVDVNLFGGALLSFVSKMKYYAHFYPYFYLTIFVLTAVISLLFLVKNLNKTGILDIKFRQNLAHNTKIRQNFIGTILIAIISLSTLLYYDLYASRPMQIDEPTIVEPDNNGEFVFDTQILADNKLHRYAYITDEGKTIRFFLLSKYEDRVVPAAVFDSCMICGDKGYVKKGSELICISCNVRIFLPSVGKPGGCNPIPFPYRVENDKVKIPLSEIVLGANYFSEIREKLVADPVSQKQIINLQSKFSYVFGDKTYFFESQANKDKFVANPEKYGAKLNNAYFRTQGHHQ